MEQITTVYLYPFTWLIKWKVFEPEDIKPLNIYFKYYASYKINLTLYETNSLFLDTGVVIFG